MIINRHTMREFGINEYDITFIQKKSNDFKNVRVFDKMTRDKLNRIASAPHFDLIEMIEAQKVFIATLRSDRVKRNKELLKVLENMKDEIMSKKANILSDLESGMLVNMLDNIKRYGTSCRSRIAELRADGHEIESKVVDEASGALAYYLPESMKQKAINEECDLDYKERMKIDELEE